MEELLHEMVFQVVNELINSRADYRPAMQASFECVMGDNSSEVVAEIDTQLLKLQQKLLKLINAKQNYDGLADEIDELWEEKEELFLWEVSKEGIR
ncbi:MAG: hypothetical protein HFG52_01720 [Lachnospiraceae bacterium]|nr:hypothetical protein [Lachnospiraceae bacterium]